MRFETNLSFPVPLTPEAKHRRRCDLELEQLKQRLLDMVLSQADDAALRAQLQRAASDAAAVAWATPCSLLVFPLLFEENVVAAQQYTRRQAQLLFGCGG